MVSIHVPMWARRRHIGSRRAAEGSIYGPMRTQPPGARDGFDPHAHVGATFDALGFRRVGDDYDLRAPRGARGRFAPRSNVGRVRVPPCRDTASRPGELIPRANVGATSDGLGSHRRRRRSIYVPMRVSPRPPRCGAVSCCLRPISLHAPMWARRQAYRVLDSLFRRTNQERSVL
jgi:hypothetical protein